MDATPPGTPVSHRPPPPNRNFATSTPAWRIALLVGLCVIGFLALGFWALSRQAINPKWVEGVVVEKLFTPEPEQQIQLGRDGLRSREVKGTYRLVVRGDDGRDYTVFVGEPAFQANAPGSRIRFLRPPPEPTPASR
ncbi:MAG: hypothetical protein JSR82_19850 [Verrucomicrobia bacterium]|nr:hypothetical protein [Verrucomicrobiota bacterium]